MSINAISPLAARGVGQTTPVRPISPTRGKIGQPDVDVSKDKLSQSDFEAIAERWNIHAMTQADLESMSSQLYEAGCISLKEHALLSFDRTKALQDLQDAGLAGEDVTLDGVGIDPDGSMDLMAEWKQRLAYREEQGMDASNEQAMVELLARLDSARVFGAKGLVV